MKKWFIPVFISYYKHLFRVINIAYCFYLGILFILFEDEKITNVGSQKNEAMQPVKALLYSKNWQEDG